MSAFKMVALSQLVEPTGQPAGNDTTLPVYSVTKHRGFVPSLEYFNKQVFSRDLSSYTKVQPGEIAYATIHLDEGSIGICPEPCLISPMYTAFKITTSEVHGPYIVRHLKSPRALTEYPRIGKGSVERRRSISLERLGTLEIPLPPLPEQQRIVEILDRADALQAKRRVALAQLDTITQSIFFDMFGDPVTNHKGWPSIRLEEALIAPLRNGVSPSHAGNIIAKVLTLSAITGSEFDETAQKVSTFQKALPPDQTVDPNDYLICRGNGNIQLVGKGYFPSRKMSDVAFPDTMIAARVSSDTISRAFLQHIWNSRVVRKQIESMARTTNGTFKVNQTMLEGITFILPPLSLQREFARRVSVVKKLKASHRVSFVELDALFASLQHLAFRGDL